MSFDSIAKNLLAESRTKQVRSDSDVLSDLERAGFSRPDLLAEYRNLFDRTDDDSIKARILKDMATIHQLMNKNEETKSAPQIVITVVGDNTRVAAMLNPAISLGGS